MRSPRSPLTCLVLLVLAAALPPAGCDRAGWATTRRQQSVEVAPGEFVTVDRVDRSDGRKGEDTEMVVRRDGRELRWKGVEIPVTLRSRPGSPDRLRPQPGP